MGARARACWRWGCAGTSAVGMPGCRQLAHEQLFSTDSSGSFAQAGCAEGDAAEGLTVAVPPPAPLPGPQRVRDQPRPALLPHRPPEPRAAVHALGGRRHLRRPRQHQRESHHRACRERYGEDGDPKRLCLAPGQRGHAGATGSLRGRASWSHAEACPCVSPAPAVPWGSALGTSPGSARLTASLPPSPGQDHLVRRHGHHPLDEGREAALQFGGGARPRHQVDQGQVPSARQPLPRRGTGTGAGCPVPVPCQAEARCPLPAARTLPSP